MPFSKYNGAFTLNDDEFRVKIVSGDGSTKAASVAKIFKSGKVGDRNFLDKDIRNGKVYFCCENCPKTYEASPKKYRIQLHRQLVETGQEVQVACPICGEPGNADFTVELGAAKVSFCGAKCLAKYNEAKTDTARLKLVFNSAAMRKSFTHQINCPVSGKPIDPKYFVEYKDEKVYFCCPDCSKAFKASPEHYASTLYQFTHKDEKAKNK